MLIDAALRIHLWLLPVMLPLNAFAAGDVGAASPKPAQTPVLASESLNSGYLVQLVVGLLFVLLCIVALAWLARRLNRFQSSSNGALQILGGISMGARERVVLVQVGSTQLLLGVAPGRINMLHQLEQPLQQDDARFGDRSAIPFGKGFADKLNAALTRDK